MDVRRQGESCRCRAWMRSPDRQKKDWHKAGQKVSFAKNGTLWRLLNRRSEAATPYGRA
ncbi:hypothetical protein XTGART2_0131 [Xanthomonas translucens pv. graminis]|jgi:hypothetical protein|uniref:Uncharacterized protein n=1 Tax=Xanthomonas graminis pv. graminis TaxID=134874 RepID=A0A1M4JDF3_9XANT|nr:hypothetical protein XTG29_00218 [Xanthomonas translucens pv. graminis ART-Xtg29]SBV38724.1 hypothetical protein XTGART9_0132 [Xanthomonas translucens pv. graminis]SBV38741.1 hypothetical protein XTGART2_0131 [Xanthomonas translucens pv. graminis]SBV45541.1 hypothetical protein XTGART29_0151 [Xanthomonas translucens pv. graminis ART-Xtg29]SBV53533.1 hypothetical protein XTGART10_0132 [Xanthomonas translucens pv. graminis]